MTTRLSFPGSGRTLAFLALLHAGAGAATEIYRWVDEDGRVHFGDQPPLSADSVSRIEPASPGDPQAAPGPYGEQRVLKVLREEREERAHKLEQAREEQERRAENCRRARNNLRRIRDAAYIYEPTADPNNPRILTDDERTEYQRSAEADVAAWCP